MYTISNFYIFLTNTNLNNEPQQLNWEPYGIHSNVLTREYLSQLFLLSIMEI